ncbi:MAG: translocation/assembly module TamB domain-containing protein [Bryobacterales bacterium]|nr:translocation/assembly module TamB domain-containing protein [Bryobacterales bacterium]
MPKALKIGAAFLLVLILAAAAAFFLIDVNQFRPIIQSQMEAALNRKVTLGGMGLSFSPLAIRAAQVSISDDPAFSSSPFLTAKQIAVQVDLMPLLKKEIKVDAVSIEEPTVELIKSPAGKWNFATLGQSSTASSSSQPFSLARLDLNNGRIGLANRQDRKPRAQYDNIDIALRNFAPAKPFTLNLTVHLPEKLDATAALNAVYNRQAGKLDISELTAKLGGLNLTGKGYLLTKPDPPALDFQLSTANAPITELAQVAAAFGQAFSKDMKVAGNLSANLRFAGPSNAPRISGDIGLARVEVNRSGWKQPVRISGAKVQFTPATLRSNTFAVESGSTRLSASLAVEDYAGKPQINAAIGTRQANLAELLRVAEAYGISAVSDVEAEGVITLDVKLAGTPAKLNYAGSGTLENTTLKLPSLTKPLQIGSTNLKFDGDRAVLDNLHASLGNTTLDGSLKLRNFTAPDIDFTAQVNQLNLTELQQLAAAPAQSTSKSSGPSPLQKLKAAGSLSVGKILYNALALSNVRSQALLEKGVLRLDPITADLFGGQQKGAITVNLQGENATYGIQTRLEKVQANELLSATTNLKNYLYGMMAAEANLNVAPKPGTDFARSLNGTLQFKLNDGKLTGVSILNEMAKIGKFLGYSPKSELVTNILTLAGAVRIANGMASTDNLTLAYDGGSLAAQGDIGLADSTLKMKLISTLAKQVGDQFGGSKIGGYLNTALTNTKGELIIPCLVSGTTAKPLFVPDSAEFARLKVQTITGPSGIAGGIQGVIEAGKTGGGKGVGGALLDMLGGRKKKE